jgi:hypothetical protein
MKYLPPVIQRWMVILLPPLSILVCCMVIVPRHQKLKEVNKNIKTAQEGVAKYLAELKAISDLPPDPTIATLPQSKPEQTDFLRNLSQLCNHTGNKMISVGSLAAQPPAPAQQAGSANTNKAPLNGGLPVDVTAIKSTMVFEGTFPSLKAILSELKGQRRLVSLNECRVSPGEGGYPKLRTSVTLTRYVDTPTPPAGTLPVQAKPKV